jgi:hypothetical protein
MEYFNIFRSHVLNLIITLTILTAVIRNNYIADDCGLGQVRYHIAYEKAV